VPVLVLPPIPEDLSNDLMEWFDESCGVFDSLKEKMLSAYSERIKRLHDMPKKAREIFWWPFTQHKLVPEGAVTVIDSRYGENFAIFKVRVIIAMVNSLIFPPPFFFNYISSFSFCLFSFPLFF
jgi:dethiobiotin synthetase/adenosylmethionine--8-amino-7-oxononanoate aminotransferase